MTSCTHWFIQALVDALIYFRLRSSILFLNRHFDYFPRLFRSIEFSHLSGYLLLLNLLLDRFERQLRNPNSFIQDFIMVLILFFFLDSQEA